MSGQFWEGCYETGYVIALTLLASAPLVSARAQQPKAVSSDPASEVDAAYRRFADAIVKKDLATLERIWADGYVLRTGRECSSPERSDSRI